MYKMCLPKQLLSEITWTTFFKICVEGCNTYGEGGVMERWH